MTLPTTDTELAAYYARTGLRPPPGSEPQMTLPDTTREAALLAEVTALARTHGWLAYHTHNSQHSARGFPDLCLTNGQDVLFVEVKSSTGKLTHDQEIWLAVLARTGKVETAVWRPKDWPAIVARLTRSQTLHTEETP